MKMTEVSVSVVLMVQHLQRSNGTMMVSHRVLGSRHNPNYHARNNNRGGCRGQFNFSRSSHRRDIMGDVQTVLLAARIWSGMLGSVEK